MSLQTRLLLAAAQTLARCCWTYPPASYPQEPAAAVGVRQWPQCTWRVVATAPQVAKGRFMPQMVFCAEWAGSHLLQDKGSHQDGNNPLSGIPLSSFQLNHPSLVKFKERNSFKLLWRRVGTNETFSDSGCHVRIRKESPQFWLGKNFR